jgi:hypothetical protein
LTSPSAFKDELFLKEFHLTKTGDLYKGEHAEGLPNGHGVAMTSKGNLLEGVFRKGIL